jgi:threonine dehydratase
VIRSPLRSSTWLSTAVSADVRLKIETLQPTFSYKIRGAFNAVLRLAEEHGDSPPVPPIVTASAGNHGRALAWAARASGMSVTVYAPKYAPRTKLDAIRATGAVLQPCADYDEAERRAKEHAALGEACFISPYSHPDVIAGAGTVGLEIHEDWPDVDVIVVPVGGGGLVSGIAIASRALSSTTEVAGVEVEASSPFTQSLAAGRIVEIEVHPTLADGLAGNLDAETITFDLVKRHVARIAVIGEAELRSAVAGVVKEERLLAEGAGAAGVAAVLAGKLDVAGRRVAIVLSGANIDADVLKALL